MKLFEIREDQSRKKTAYIDASHKWGLPGVVCPVCRQTWSTVGLEYPSIDFSDFIDEHLYRTPRTVSLVEFQRLRDKVADAFPDLKFLQPGAQFGALVGTAIGGRVDGFVWRSWWTICLEAQAIKKLKDRGLSLPKGVKAEIKFTNENQTVLEFDLPLKGKLANGLYNGFQLKYCDGCGRDSASLPNDILIEEFPITDNADIFRVSNFTTLILVTEKFVDAVMALGIKGAVFNEVKTN